MSKNIYNEFQIKELEKNPNVLSPSERSISYSPEFKLKAVMDYKSGNAPYRLNPSRASIVYLWEQ